MSHLRITRDLVKVFTSQRRRCEAALSKCIQMWALPDMSYSSSVNEPKALPSRLRLYAFCGAIVLLGVTYLVVTGEVVH